MKVELLSYTPDALNLLLRTKNTRLAGGEDPATWSDEKRQEHLEYMRDTIKSSWEFVSYTFKISGVTRAFTHQLVRTRTGSYAQEAMRVVDASTRAVDIPPSVKAIPAADDVFNRAADIALTAYAEMEELGVPRQDARGILPTNILTSICANFNLRTLSDMAKVRLCTRTQGEYQNAFRAMRAAVVGVHPWAAEFIEVQCVATGTCAFPRYGKKDCKFYDPRMDLTTLRKEVALRFWSEEMQEAQPVLKDGKTM